MRALFLGSIGVLAETSNMQRDAFNRAFTEADLGWYWDEEIYAEMLSDSGGKARIDAYGKERGQTVDAQALHERKSELFRKALADGVLLRDGVAEAMAEARRRDCAVAFVTATSPDNVDAILAATGVAREEFDLIVDQEQIDARKPAPDAYQFALNTLSLSPEDVLAVEDNPDGVSAARAAGLECIATPGAMHQRSDFSHATAVQQSLKLPETATMT